jgi:hypothetical protein
VVNEDAVKLLLDRGRTSPAKLGWQCTIEGSGSKSSAKEMLSVNGRTPQEAIGLVFLGAACGSSRVIHGEGCGTGIKKHPKKTAATRTSSVNSLMSC